MECGKAPGIDGLPAEVYKCFWAVIVTDLLEVPNNSLTRHLLPLSFRRAVVTLLPKKDDLKNWKPVSLLCRNYKPLFKTSAAMLGRILEEAIHADQTCCAPERTMFNNTSWVGDIDNISSLSGLNIGLDVYRPGDGIRLTGTLLSVEKLSKPLVWVLNVNGGLCARFKASRGGRRGCSLLAVLCALTVEHLVPKLIAELKRVLNP